MSRRIVSNQSDLLHIIHSEFTDNENHAHRRLVFLDIVRHGWLDSFAQLAGCHYVSPSAIADRADRISALLGDENFILAHEISDPVDAGLLAAMAGTLTAGGWLILANPDSSSRFNQRLTQLIMQLERDRPDSVLIVDCSDQGQATHTKPLLSNKYGAKDGIPFSGDTQAQAEQDRLYEQARNYLAASEHSLISITGKRGRGKSTLLARIANWLNAEERPYRVTALNPSALNSFHKQTDHDSTALYCTPFDAANANTKTLLIDEAGNLSIDTMAQLITQHDQLVCSTTVEGYERAGRAFELRFNEISSTHPAAPLQLKPEQPWRWKKDDPLESLIDTLVLNYPESALHKLESKPAIKSYASKNIGIRKIEQDLLLENESLLHGIYSLLRQTHYQTSVQDLQHLLDGRNMQVWILEDNDKSLLLGVALVTLEHIDDTSVYVDIVNKQRRLPHHLLPQLLAQSANSEEPLYFKYARITRISIAEACRRNGLATTLLNEIEKELVNENSENSVDAIGASFASDYISQRFWQANGYSPFHEGYRNNPRTGRKASAVIKSGRPSLNSFIEKAALIFNDNTAMQANDHRPSQGLIEESRGNQSAGYDDELIRQFAMGHRSVHDTQAALQRLSKNFDLPLYWAEGVSRKAYEKKLKQAVFELLESSSFGQQ